MPDSTFIAVLQIHLFFPDAESLKAKRSELRPVKAGLKRFGVAMAEVDHQDTWQRSTLAVSLCGDSVARCQDQVGTVERYLESTLPQGFQFEQRIVSWNDLDALL